MLGGKGVVEEDNREEEGEEFPDGRYQGYSKGGPL